VGKKYARKRETECEQKPKIVRAKRKHERKNETEMDTASGIVGTR
jgi:hypothetical protein